MAAGTERSANLEFKLWGHASVEMALKGFSLLLDPWFGTSNHFGSFHAFPAIREPRDEDISRIQAIHISHVHVDHFCAQSLSRFPRSTPIFIAKYDDGGFREKVRALGFDTVVEVPMAPAEIEVGPFRLSSVPSRDDPAYNSILVVRTADQNFLFNTDSRLPIEVYDFLRMYFGSFTGCFVGYTPFGPFPTCYDFTACESMSEAQDVNQMIRTTHRRYMRYVSEICEVLRPQWIVPYASGIRLLCRDQSLHNRMFTPLAEMSSIETSGAEVIEMRPEDSLIMGETGAPSKSASNLNPLNLLNAKSRELSSSDVPSELDLRLENFKTLDTLASLACDANQIRSHFRDFVERNLARSAALMTVEIKLTALDGIDTFEIHFDGKSAVNSGSPIQGGPDLSLSYPAGAIRRVLSGEMTMSSVHFAYAFEARVLRVVAPMRHYFVHQWR